MNTLKKDALMEMTLNNHFTMPEFLQDYIFKVMFELGWDRLMRNKGLKIVFY